MDYLWVKALHIIAVMSWMAGLLYLPRLFVYHSMVEAESSVRAQTFKLMERRLLKIIMNPAMVSVLGVRFMVGIQKSCLLEMPWMWVKFICIIMMTVAHMVFARMRRQWRIR